MMTYIELTPKIKSNKESEGRLGGDAMLQPLSKRSIELVYKWLHRDSVVKGYLDIIFVVSALLFFFGVFISNSVNFGLGASLLWLVHIPLGLLILLMTIALAFILSRLVYEAIRFFRLCKAHCIDIEGGSLANIIHDDCLFSPLCSDYLTILRTQTSEFPELKVFFQEARTQERELFKYEYDMAQSYVEEQRRAKQYRRVRNL